MTPSTLLDRWSSKIAFAYSYPSEYSCEVGVRNVKQCETNINIGLHLAACSTILQTITQAQIFDAYLYLNSNGSNTIVGIGESIVGLTALLVMLPAAAFVDRRDRGLVCNLAANAAAGGAVMSLYGLWVNSLFIIFTSMIIWGIHWELSNSASDCIFIDSLPVMDRTNMITKKTVVQTVSCSLGIAVQLIFFLVFGDNWSIYMCKIILSLGYLVFTPVVMKQLYTMKDRRFVPVTIEDETNVTAQSLTDMEQLMETGQYHFASVTESDSESVSTAANSCPSQNIKTYKEANSLVEPMLEKTVVVGSKRVSSSSATQQPPADRETFMLGRLSNAQTLVPYLVGASDMIRAVGAGMTVKFFALFFMNEV
eukprot:GHVH01005610.1.p1 GENE.GHVH01005610.1~~GHVH01005610.1.p1  ORF type:complete len:367 (+),score=42.09 GHVH01005610.1:468-1568(+)